MPEEMRVLNGISQFGGSLATIKGLQSNLGMDRVQVRHWVHRLIGAGYIKAHSGGSIGVICYSLTVEGQAELPRSYCIND